MVSREVKNDNKFIWLSLYSSTLVNNVSLDFDILVSLIYNKINVWS